MNLKPGCPLVVAPRFHVSIDWPARLLLGTMEEEGGGIFPRLDWRAPTADEQSMLVGDPTALTKDEALADGLCLFALPQHLRTTFWTMLEQAEATSHIEGFDSFAGEVARFLDFKGLTVPVGAVFDLLVNKPGQRSVQWNPETGRPVGLTFDLAPWVPWPIREEAHPPRLCCGINLGDEAVSLLFVNLPARRLLAEVTSKQPDQAPPTTMGELAERFLSQCQGYPLVRLRIEPGEGYRIPAGGMLIDACTLDMQGPSLLLMVRREGDSEACPIR